MSDSENERRRRDKFRSERRCGVVSFFVFVSFDLMDEIDSSQ